MHSYFTLFTKHKIHKRPHQNSKHISKPKGNSLKKTYVHGHNYVLNPKPKITSKLRKVLQGKVNKKHSNVTHNFEGNFSMKSHPKRWVSNAKITTNDSQTLKSLYNKI
jgi:hypothetical protein